MLEPGKPYKTNSILSFYKRHPLLCLAGILTIISFFIYHDFILGNQIYVYTDIASDMYAQTLPTLSYTAQYAGEQGYPLWSFSMGLGGNLYASVFSFGDPFISLSILMGKGALPYSLGILQAAKPVVAGVFFFLFLKTAGVKRDVSFLVAIMYAFCGHMIARGGWLSYPNEVVWVALVLYAMERYISKRDLRLLPFAVALLFLSLKGYQSLVYTVYLFAFALLRYYTVSKTARDKFAPFILKYIGLFALGGLLSAVIFVPNLMYGFGYGRIDAVVSDGSALLSGPGFHLANAYELFSAFFRTISMDAIGTGSAYTGAGNYLEGPLFYCGVLMPLVLLQSFVLENKRKRNAVIIMLAFSFCYIIFPSLRYAVNGFATGSYKHTSFIIVVMFLYASALVLEEMIFKRKVNFLLLSISFGIILGVSLGVYWTNQWLDYFTFETNILLLSLAMACLYFILYVLYYKKRLARRVFLIVTAAALCFEAGITSYNAVNNRDFLDRDFVSDKISYGDYTNEAVAYLNEREDGGFFRMETDYNGELLCSSLYQNFYGVKSYTWQTKYMMNLYTFLNAGLARTPNAVWPFNNRYALNSMLGIKYLLSFNEGLSLPGFEGIGNVDGIFVFENQNALSLGALYDKYVYASELEKTDNSVRDMVLLNAVALEDGADVPAGMEHFDIAEVESEKTVVDIDIYETFPSGMENVKTENNMLEFEPLEGGAMIDIPFAAESSVADISFDLSAPANTDIQFYLQRGEEILHTQEIAVEEGDNSVSISSFGAGTDHVTLIFNTPGAYSIQNIHITSLPDILFERSIAERQTHMMNIEDFSQNDIRGEIKSTGESLLFLSIPYDKGWSATVDGQEKEIILVDKGLTGIYLEDGEHEVKLSFRPPYMKVGGIISICALAAYIFLLARAGKKRRSIEKR